MKVLRSSYKVCSFTSIEPKATIHTAQSPCYTFTHSDVLLLNPLMPNDHYSGRTAPLTSKRCILYIYSTNIGTEYFKHGIYSSFFLF